MNIMMESGVSEAKYQKLASEYSKLRAQACVLKKAVLEEKAKEVNLRDQLRLRETSLRRAEQEVDSLGFRNRQLESRVSALQQDLASCESRKKKDKDATKRNVGMDDTEAVNESSAESFVLQELEKKVMENAQLVSLIADKEKDILLYSDRISCLESMLEKQINEQNEMEKRLRKDIEEHQNKNSDLETKLLEAASLLGSEDTLSNAGSDSLALSNMNSNFLISNSAALSTEDRITILEKDSAYWRAQYEVAKLNQTICSNKQNEAVDSLCNCTTSATGITLKPNNIAKSSSQSKEFFRDLFVINKNEQLIFNNFSKKYEDLMYLKYFSESRISSLEAEILNLQCCLEQVSTEVKAKDIQLTSLNLGLKMLEEDLATTRSNYEEQISVLTEQVICLSEQLASSK